MTTTTQSAATLRAVLSRSLPTPSFVVAAAAAAVVIFHFISIINTVMIAFIPAI